LIDDSTITPTKIFANPTSATYKFLISNPDLATKTDWRLVDSTNAPTLFSDNSIPGTKLTNNSITYS